MTVQPTSTSQRHRVRPALLLALALWVGATWAETPASSSPEAAVQAEAVTALPSMAELEALGARIGTIDLSVNSIFDLNDPNENWSPFRWANRLHIPTRPAVIRSGLLFQSGDPLSSQRIDETERVLRRSRYLYDVQIRPRAWHPESRIVDLEVVTRDTWTLAPGISASRSGGSGSNSLSLRELNLLGTGIALEVGHARSVDRSGTEYAIASDRAFGHWISFQLSTSQNSDGQRHALRLARPFYALDTPWSAGISLTHDERIDAVYRGGEVDSRYRREENDAELFAGWARHPRPGWVQRSVLGISRHEDRYASAAGLPSPPILPPDETFIAPFLRLELLQDQFEKTRNLNQIGRTEYLARGWSATVQLGRALPTLGSTRDTWLYQATVRRGFEPWPRHTLLASGSVSGQYTHGNVERQRASALAQYFHPVNHQLLHYVSIAADALTRPGPLDMLLLGGDSGLRGYPLRYQAGDRRILITFEERLYTDWYWLHLFRVGAAAFADVGRAWGGTHIHTDDPGWLANVGVGLRIFSVRAAFGTVLHLDVAMPINPNHGIEKTQFLIKTKSSF
jgi:hypothetical protein